MVKDKYNTILQNILEEKGSATLFAVLSVDDLIESLTIMLAADWINDENSGEIFGYLLAELQKQLDDGELSKITRVGVYSVDEHPIELFRGYKTGDKIFNEEINGFDVKSGLIIYSNFE